MYSGNEKSPPKMCEQIPKHTHFFATLDRFAFLEGPRPRVPQVVKPGTPPGRARLLACQSGHNAVTISPMARKPIHRELPSLREQVPGFRRFGPGANKTFELEKQLRHIAERCRRKRPTPFYAMHEVAAFFGITVSTVGRVYRRLEKEGLLVPRRGSATELTALKPLRRVAHRGVVAVPIWLPGFLLFEPWRVFFVELEERLRRHNFVASLIFYHYEEELHPAFVHRVLLHNPEYFIWLMPLITAVPTMEMLTDKGVRPIVLTKGGDPAFHGQRYLLRTEHGGLCCLETWKARGIASVRLVCSQGPSEDLIVRQAREAGMECQLTVRGKTGWSEILDGLGREQGGGVLFADDFLVGTCFSEAAPAMAALVRRAPVLLAAPLVIPPDLGKPGQPDWLSFDWKAIARRIAQDLDTGRVFSAAPPTVFEAEWKPQIPLTKVLGGE